MKEIDIPTPFSTRSLQKAGFRFLIGSEGSPFLKRKHRSLLTVTDMEEDVWTVEKSNKIERVTDKEWWEATMIG